MSDGVAPMTDIDTFQYLGSRILTHYDAAVKLLAGEMPAPRTAIVYPTYVCNQGCPGCEYQYINAEGHGMMGNDDFHDLIDDLAGLGVKGIEFCGGGEPTLHPELAAVIGQCAGLGMKTGLLTNGTMLKGGLAEAVVEHASYVRIGLDAATKETFEQTKRPGPNAGFDTVIGNIRELLALRKEGNSSVNISIKFLVSKDNLHELEAFVELGKKLGVDSVQFKAVRVYGGLLTKEQEEEIQKRIDDLKEANPGFPVVGGVEKVTIATKCWLNPLQIMIDALGDVYLCCYYLHRKDRHTIGNAFKDDLKKLWGSQRHWDAIKNIKPAECNNLDCRFVHYNKVMDALVRDGEGQFEFI